MTLCLKLLHTVQKDDCAQKSSMQVPLELHNAELGSCAGQRNPAGLPCVPVDCLICLAKARGHLSMVKVTSVVTESGCFAMPVCLRLL